jgi:hypothetical protein
MDSCEYTEYPVADSQQGVVIQLGGWAHFPTIKNKLVTKDHKKPPSPKHLVKYLNTNSFYNLSTPMRLALHNEEGKNL